MAAGAVGEELADEVAGEEIGAGVADDLLEAVEVRIRFTGGELAGGVDLGCGRFAVLGFWVGAAPATDGVEGFETEAQGVNLAMALGAGLVGAVLGETLANRRGAADIGIDRGHDIGWGRWRDAEDVFTDPHAAGDG